MHCSYCIAGELPKLSMLPEIGRNAIDMFIYLSRGAESLEFIFTGGEPFLEYSTLKALVSHAQQRANEAEVDVYFVVKTNGTILNEAIVDFIAENNVRVVISLDGTNESHDMYRKDSMGHDTHDVILQHLRILLNRSIDCVVSLTIHPNLVKTMEHNVRYLHEIGVKHIELGPVYGTVLWPETESLAFVQSMSDIARYMQEANKTCTNLEVGPLYQNSKHIGEALSEHWGCGALSTNIAFMPNGQIAGCSSLAMLSSRYPELIVGDVRRGLKDNAVNYLLHLAQVDHEERVACQKCKTLNNCDGGCLAINYSTTGFPLTPPEFYCKIISSIPGACKIAWGDKL